MTRLQKKCLVASACLHGLTGVVVLATAAFRPEPVITQQQVLTLIPGKILDRAGVGGEIPPAPVTSKPAQPATPAAPAPTQPQPVSRSAQPEIQPQPHPPETPKPVARNVPTQPKVATVKEATETAPKQRHVVTPEYNTPVGSATKKPAKTADSTAQANAAARAATNQRLQAIEGAFAGVTSKISSTKSGDHAVTSPGENGGEAFVGYTNVIFNVYYRAWKTPDDTTHSSAIAHVKIVVMRNGDIISSEFVKRSGDSLVDKSVQRALDQVERQKLPPFPTTTQDTQRTFFIEFNLEAKQSEG